MTTKGLRFPDRFPPAIERFLSAVMPVTESGCWIWMDHLLASGYGALYTTKNTRAHRFSYEHFVGPIPEGMVIDHLCGIKCCVNPDHLEAVPQKENMRRAWARKSRKPFCRQGHPRSGDNAYKNPTTGDIACRECVRISVRKYQERKRQNAKR